MGNDNEFDAINMIFWFVLNSGIIPLKYFR